MAHNIENETGEHKMPCYDTLSTCNNSVIVEIYFLHAVLSHHFNQNLYIVSRSVQGLDRELMGNIPPCSRLAAGASTHLCTFLGASFLLPG